MDIEKDGVNVEEPRVEVEAYDPPKVESALSAEDLAREIQYAGQPSAG